MATATASETITQRANQTMDRAREMERRFAEGDGPTDEQLAEFNGLVDEAAGLYRRAEVAQQAGDRFRALAETASTPAGRSGPRISNPFGGGDDGLGGMGRDDYPGDSMRSRSLLPHEDAANTRNGKHAYSFMRALAGAVALKDGHGFHGLEAEVSQELVSRRAKPTKGVLIPWNAPLPRGGFPSGVKRRDLTTTTGAGAIPTLVQGTLIDLLRARMVLQRLGATILTGMTAGFGIPRQSAGVTGYWVAEGVAPTATNATIDLVELDPKTVAGTTKLTRRFILQAQGSVDAEMFAIDDLVATIQRTVEAAAFIGSGTSAQPLGIIPYGGSMPTVAMGAPNGGPPTWLKTLEFISKLSAANVPLETRAWCINPQTKAKFGGVPREAGFPKYLYDFDDPASPIAGFPVEETTLLPSNITKGSGTNLSAAIFGAWQDLVIAMFSGIDVVVDPYTESTAGNVRISAFQDVDVNVRHPESFVVCTDINTATA